MLRGSHACSWSIVAVRSDLVGGTDVGVEAGTFLRDLLLESAIADEQRLCFG